VDATGCLVPQHCCTACAASLTVSAAGGSALDPPTLLGMSRLIHCQRGRCRAYKQAGLHSMAAQLRE
jgi:hypothetical protein